jgi:hypothetical protein
MATTTVKKSMNVSELKTNFGFGIRLLGSVSIGPARTWDAVPCV